MDNSKKFSLSGMAMVGYFAWFALLVMILYETIGKPSHSFAETVGINIGLGLGLFGLAGIPYVVATRRAKRRGEPMPWFLVMTWTTIIALLIAFGNLYIRLQPHTQPPVSSSNLVQPTAPNTIQGEWVCVHNSSAKKSRLFLNENGSVSSTLITLDSQKVFHDPYLYWYQPLSPTNDYVMLLALELRSDGVLVVRWPSNRVEECVKP